MKPYNSFSGICRSIKSYDYGKVYNGVAVAAHNVGDAAHKVQQDFNKTRTYIKASYEKNPVSSFPNNALRASAKLRSYRQEVVIGRVNPDGVEKFCGDTDVYDGTISSLSAVRRVTYNHEHKTFNNIYGKVAEDLEGKRNEYGVIFSTASTVKRSYRGESYYAPNVNPANPVVPQEISDKLLEDWKEYCKELSERTRKHFTLYRASIGRLDTGIQETLRDVIDPDTRTEIFTNGRFCYTLDEQEDGTYNVRAYAPARRKGGKFLAVSLNHSCGFDKVSKNIGEGLSYEQAQHCIASDWEDRSRRLWEEEKVPSLKDGTKFYAEYAAKRVINWPRDEAWDFAGSFSFGVTTGVITNSLAVGTVAAAVGHAVHDNAFKQKGKRLVRHLKRKVYKPRHYGDKDASDFYKKNIDQTASKANENVKPEHEQILNFAQSHFPDGTKRDDSMRPHSIRGLVASIDERGISSIADIVETTEDDRDIGARINRYQNGMVVMKVCDEIGDGDEKRSKEVFFATYRADVVLSDGILGDGSYDSKKDRRLPKHYREQIEDKIIRIEYTSPQDRDAEGNPQEIRFDDAFEQSEVTHAEMMAEVTGGKLLFKDKPFMSQDAKDEMYDMISDFVRPVSEGNGQYLRGDIKPIAQDVGYLDADNLAAMREEFEQMHVS